MFLGSRLGRKGSVKKKELIRKESLKEKKTIATSKSQLDSLNSSDVVDGGADAAFASFSAKSKKPSTDRNTKATVFQVNNHYNYQCIISTLFWVKEFMWGREISCKIRTDLLVFAVGKLYFLILSASL